MFIVMMRKAIFYRLVFCGITYVVNGTGSIES